MLLSPIKVKYKQKRLAKALLGISLLLAGIVTSLGPAITPTIAQDANNTDLFTGQFIPAYLGAAYDPSEAYKQMAGMTVYVFAYDKPGTIIKNYVYKTQVRADGSFQAAGLSNASHYGICFPGRLGDLQPFRVPLNEDQLNTIFAFNSGTWPSESAMPLDQTGAQANRIPGCRTFYTSSKSVDITNHINIFPLIPNTVLSVIIKDAQATSTSGNFDLYNNNTPYEVYAQRISINSTTQGLCSYSPTICIGTDNKPITIESKNSLVSGPIIRGRTIPLTTGNAPYQGATIFQAYAPQGIYAITYWRPDTRDTTTAITYLNFNGSQSINTAYNGIAFENVVASGSNVTVGDGQTSSNQWLLSTRDYNSHPTYAWQVKPGNLNIWGIAQANRSGSSAPIGGPTISIASARFGFINPATRTCRKGNADSQGNKTALQSGPISDWGIYLFSTSCLDSVDPLSTRSTQITIKAYTDSAKNQYQGIDNKTVRVTGYDGPARNDVSLASVPKDGAKFKLLFPNKTGKVGFTPFTTFNLTVDGKTYWNVAESDATNTVIIPGIYFSNSPTAKYTVWSSSPKSGFGAANINTSFIIDGSTLHNPTVALNDLGTIDTTPKQSQLASTLSALNFSGLFDRLRISRAYADSGDGNPENMNRSDVKIFLNMKVISSMYGGEGAASFFTVNNYDLTKVEMDLPPELDNGNANYVSFNAYDNLGSNAGQKDGMLTTDTLDSNDQANQSSLNNGSATNNIIVGVHLKEKDVERHPLDAAYQAYQAYQSSDDLQPMPLTLKIEFKKTDQATLPQGTVDNKSTVQQDTSNLLPTVLSAEIPVILMGTPTSEDDTKYAFTMSYGLVPLQMRAPGCDVDNGNGIFGTHIGSSVLSSIQQGLCDGIGASTSFFGWGINYIADHLVTVDPLQYAITGQIWNVMRNLVNGLAVVLLIIYGIAIMLRYEPGRFNLQNGLTTLIVTIILVNFSILIIQFAIDVANVASAGGYHFILSALKDVNSGPDLSSTMAGVTSMAGLSAAAFAIILSSGGSILFAVLLGLFAIVVALLYVLAKTVWFWILRQLVLIICIVVAPLALAARILPGTQPYYMKWRTMLTKTLISQIMFAFVLALAMAMLQVGIKAGYDFMTSLVSIGLAGGLFYYSTKFPAQAIAALDAGLGASISGGVMKAVAGLRAAPTKIREGRLKREANVTWRKEQEKALGVENLSFLNRRFAVAANQLESRGESLLGLKPEELKKAREEGYARSDQDVLNRLQRKNKGAYQTAEELERDQHHAELEVKHKTTLKNAQSVDALKADIHRKEKDDLAAVDTKLAQSEINMNNEVLIDRRRQEQTLNTINKTTAEIEAERILYAPGNENALQHERDTEVDSSKFKAEDRIANAQGMYDYASIQKGEREEAVLERELKLGDRSADAVAGTTYTESKDYGATTTALSAEYGYLDDDGNVVHTMGNVNRDALGNETLYGIGWNQYRKDIISKVDPSKRTGASRALNQIESQLSLHPELLKDTKSGYSFVTSGMRYIDADGNNLRGLAATTAMLNDMDIKTAGLKPPQIANLAQKMLTEKVIGSVSKTNASDDLKSAAAAWVKDNQRSLTQLGNTGISDKTFIDPSTLTPGDPFHPSTYGITIVGPGGVGPVPNTFTKGTEVVYGLPSKPIRGKKAEDIVKALQRVAEAQQKSAANQLWDYVNDRPGGPDLSVSTDPTTTQYAAALQTLKEAGYKTRR